MIHGIQQDRQGKLWLGTFGKGLIVFSPEGKKELCASIPLMAWNRMR